MNMLLVSVIQHQCQTKKKSDLPTHVWPCFRKQQIFTPKAGPRFAAPNVADLQSGTNNVHGKISMKYIDGNNDDSH